MSEKGWLEKGLREIAREATPEMKARVAASPSGFLPARSNTSRKKAKMADRKVHKQAVPARGISQLAGYILNEAPFVSQTDLREWIETWLDAWCPRDKKEDKDG